MFLTLESNLYNGPLHSHKGRCRGYLLMLRREGQLVPQLLEVGSSDSEHQHHNFFVCFTVLLEERG